MLQVHELRRNLRLFISEKCGPHTGHRRVTMKRSTQRMSLFVLLWIGALCVSGCDFDKKEFVEALPEGFASMKPPRPTQRRETGVELTA